MPTVPNIGQISQPEMNPLAKPSPTDLLMAAATTASLADVAKRKPKGKGK